MEDLVLDYGPDVSSSCVAHKMVARLQRTMRHLKAYARLQRRRMITAQMLARLDNRDRVDVGLPTIASPRGLEQTARMFMMR